jgi:hypothetical protein
MDGIYCLVNIGRKIRDYFEKRGEHDVWLKALIDFDNALRIFLAVQPTPANGRIQFLDDDILISVEPVPEEEDEEEKSKNNDE